MNNMITPAEIHPSSVPTTREEWSTQVTKCGRTLAHVYASKCQLPQGFDFWDIQQTNDGTTVAHTAAYYECLPSDFDQWYLTDVRGRTVAHAAAAKGHVFPPYSPYWDLETTDGLTVRQVYQDYIKYGPSTDPKTVSEPKRVFDAVVEIPDITSPARKWSKAVERGVAEACESVLAGTPLAKVVDRVEALVEKETAEYRLRIHQLKLEIATLKQINESLSAESKCPQAK